MPKSAARKTEKRSENSVLDQAIRQLLSATRDAAEKKGTPVSPEQLREDGYSERFIERVAKA